MSGTRMDFCPHERQHLVRDLAAEGKEAKDGETEAPDGAGSRGQAGLRSGCRKVCGSGGVMFPLGGRRCGFGRRKEEQEAKCC